MRLLFLILLLSVWAAPAHAHKPSDSYLTFSAQGDVPLPDDAIALNRKGKVTIARLVGMSRHSPHPQQQNQRSSSHQGDGASQGLPPGSSQSM